MDIAILGYHTPLIFRTEWNSVSSNQNFMWTTQAAMFKFKELVFAIIMTETVNKNILVKVISSTEDYNLKKNVKKVMPRS